MYGSKQDFKTSREAVTAEAAEAAAEGAKAAEAAAEAAEAAEAAVALGAMASGHGGGGGPVPSLNLDIDGTPHGKRACVSMREGGRGEDKTV